jgi:hypothetical protein
MFTFPIMTRVIIQTYGSFHCKKSIEENVSVVQWHPSTGDKEMQTDFPTIIVMVNQLGFI